MSDKLTWNEIEKRYDKEWVQLVDYDWPEGLPFPKSGVVRVHAQERKEFYRKAQELEPNAKDSAFVFVGVPAKEPGVIYNNFHKTVS